MDTVAAIYTRRSSGTEDDSTSLETQLAHSKAFIISKGWVVGPVYAEGVKSGVTIADRPVMKRLLVDIEAGKVHSVVALRPSRMSRNGWESLEIIGRSRRNRCEWYFVHGGVPESLRGTPDELSFYGFFIVSGVERDRDTIESTLTDGLKAREDRGGRRGGSKDPYGWKRVDLPPDPKPRRGWTLAQERGEDGQDNEAAVVAEMYRRLVGGVSVRRVTRWLQGSAHPTPKGLDPSRWSDTAVKDIIKNPANYGRVVTDVYESVKGTNSSKMRPESEWRDIPNAKSIKPIVDEPTWRAAVAALADNATRSGGKKSPDNLGLLSYGVVRCACPGGAHALQWRSDKGGRYKTDQKAADRVGCLSQSISSPPLDAKVWADVLKVVADPEALITQLNEQVAGDTAADALKEAKTWANKLVTRVKNLGEAISDEGDRAARKELQAQRADLIAQRTAAEDQVKFLAAQAARADWLASETRDLFDELREMQAGFEALDLDGRREVLERLAVRVYVVPQAVAGKGNDRDSIDIGIRPRLLRDEELVWPAEHKLPALTWEDIAWDEAEDRMWDEVEWGDGRDYRQPSPGIDNGDDSGDTGGVEGGNPEGTDSESIRS